MNSFVIVFSALIVAVASSAVRNTGWGSVPQVELEMDAALAIAGSGSGAADQQTAQHAVGDAHVPASIQSVSGIDVQLAQAGAIAQIGQVDLNSGSTGTLQTVDAEQYASSIDALETNVAGQFLAEVQNSASTNAQGEGSMVAAGSSYNDVNNSGH